MAGFDSVLRVGGSAAQGALTGATLGSFVPGVGNVVGAGVGGLVGLVKGIHDEGPATAPAGMNGQAPAAPTQPSALDTLMLNRATTAQAVHDRANPFGGNAWQTSYNQQAQGLAGQGAQAEAAGLARAGASGSQMGLVAQTAARQQQANALSALRANTQQRYQDMGNQYQQANDRDYQNALGGQYTDLAHQAELGYQHDEAAAKNTGSFVGNILGAGGQILSSPLGNTALQALLKNGWPGAAGSAAPGQMKTYGGAGDMYGPTPAAGQPIYPTPTGQPSSAPPTDMFSSPPANPYLTPPAPSYSGQGFHLGGDAGTTGGFSPNGFKLGGF